MKKFILLFAIALTTASCTELLKVANQISTTTGISPIITNADNVAGLKSSLNVGIENAVSLLGKENGFLDDAALKLLLPEEAQSIVNNIKLIPGGQELVNKAVLSLNRSAEDAVKEATPIFKNAITSMTINDALGILLGNQDAATQYLRNTTYAQLKAAFAPKVKDSLGKPLVANISTTESWTALTSSYNKVAGTAVGSIAGMKAINVNLEEYVTEKALDALFTKVANEEKAIRTDPAARVNDILKKVFGQLDKK
ncbi:MAG: hypothetical protein H6Q20_158 [Bacteroidetes bacterium]|jgi:hypothetical protein|nr:hypothetical protein [Bacteroidota bacterium]